MGLNSSVRTFLDQTATTGTWYGGGSAAAFTCALSAALLEKLARSAVHRKPLRTIRTRCLRLVKTDADSFARVVRAHSRHDARATTKALKAAIDVPLQVCRDASQARKISIAIRPSIRRHYDVDLRCAVELAQAAGKAARALVTTNLTWLDDPKYSRRIRQQLTSLR